MGNSDSKASDYVKLQWAKDAKAKHCFHCSKPFSVSTRKHHCRCCGEIFCKGCWGNLITLPTQYGYRSKQPVCNACERLMDGDLRLIRHPRRIVMTRSLRGAKHADQPPLSAANVQAENFEVFFMKVAHFRPLGHGSILQFAVTLRTANSLTSSYQMDKQREEQNPPPRVRDLVRDSEEFDTGSGSGGGGGGSSCAGSFSNRQPTTSSIGASAPPSISSRQTSIALGVSPESVNIQAIQEPVDAVQLDVAWSLPLDSILQVVLDHHPESDFIAVETAQEVYRIQVADVTVPEDELECEAYHRSGVHEAVGSFDGGIPGPTESTDRVESSSVPTHSKLMANAMCSPRSVEGNTDLGSPRPCLHTSSSVTDTPNKSKRVTITCGPSQGHVEEADDHVTSKPVRGATYTVNVDATNAMLRDLQQLVKIVGDRDNSRAKIAGGAHKYRKTKSFS